jgi:hypothetical protein
MTVLDAFWVGSEAKSLYKGAVGAGKAGDAVFNTSKARRPGSANPGVSDAENVVEHPNNWELVPEPHNPFAPRIGEPKKQIGVQQPKLLGERNYEAKRADVQKRIELNSVVRRENPVTPYSVVEQANPESARAMHEAIMEGDDEIAQALTGVTVNKRLQTTSIHRWLLRVVLWIIRLTKTFVR